MKKILIVFSLSILLFGCNSFIDNSSNTIIEQNGTIHISNLETNKDPVVLKPNNHLKDYFLQHNMKYPTTINVFIGENGSDIGFLYEYGIKGLNEDEIRNNCHKDEWGNYYLYYGSLSKVGDNIYIAKGKYLPTWNYFENYISKGIDFYMVNKNNYYYFIFDNISINELASYSSDAFALTKE